MTDSLFNPKAKRAEAAVWEGRSRIVWGENPSEILEYMIGEGVDEQHARDLIGIALKERDEHIRARGRNSVTKGLIAIVIGGIGAALAIKYDPYPKMRRSPMSYVFAAFGMLFLWGLFHFIRGLRWALSGSKMRGSVTDMDDQVP